MHVKRNHVTDIGVGCRRVGVGLYTILGLKMCIGGGTLAEVVEESEGVAKDGHLCVAAQ